MPRLREELDADRIKTSEPTEYETGQNRYKLPCGVCGQTLYVDRQTLESYEKALEYDPDNQFMCADCELEYEESAHE